MNATPDKAQFSAPSATPADAAVPGEKATAAGEPKGNVNAPSRRPALALLEHLFTDNRGNVSRPKLLFAISMLDALAVGFAGVTAYAMALGRGAFATPVVLQVSAVALLAVAVLNRNWSYTVPSLRRLPAQAVKVVTSILTVFLGLAGFAYLAGAKPIGPLQALLWLAMALTLLTVIRMAVALLVQKLSETGRLTRRTVIVGGGKEAEELMQALADDNSSHLQILGIFDDRQDERMAESAGGIATLGTFESLTAFCQDQGVDLLIVTVPVRAEDRLLQILQQLFSLQADIRISALNSKLRLNASAYTRIGKVPMLAVMDKPLSDWDRAVKNLEDRLLGALLLVVVAPIMALTALAVRLDSKGPILFKQKRFGFNNQLIEVYKFRSMYSAMSDATASVLVTKGDSRVTRVGRFIRRASLDELPQLFNVLLGEMSLVGPRPHATQAKAETDLYQDVVQGYFARHRVKPGVTGWAQINGWRGETDTHDKIQRRVEHDLYYIDHWSVLFDLYIIAMTPFSLVAGKNAY